VTQPRWQLSPLKQNIGQTLQTPTSNFVSCVRERGHWEFNISIPMRERTKPQGARLERILRNFPRLSENSQGSGGPETCQSPLSPRGQEMTGEKAINIKRMRADAKTDVYSMYLEFKTKATKHVLHANIFELPVLAELPQRFFSLQLTSPRPRLRQLEFLDCARWRCKCHQ
jgi:hypothetical protein